MKENNLFQLPVPLKKIQMVTSLTSHLSVQALTSPDHDKVKLGKMCQQRTIKRGFKKIGKK